MKDIFKDLKVIELASVLAGPAVGLFFAELGAEVIKIENKKTKGDVTRRWKLPDEPKNSSVSAYYASVNGGKEALLLDLSDRGDQQKVHEMVRQADIVISNFKEKSAVRMQMDYEHLRSLNPRLIYAQLYAFGQGIDRPAFDVVLQAEAGFLYMTGEPGRSPVKMPVALIDLLAAHQLKEGILIALLRREREGRGSFVSTSLLEAAIASLANQATNWLVAGHIPQPMGSAHPNIAPYGDVFSCRDEKLLVVAVGTEQQFVQLCKALEVEVLLEDPRFQQNTVRVAHREELWEALQSVFRNFSREEAAQKLEAAKVPYGCIRNMEEVFQMPQAQALIREETAEDGRLVKSVRTAVFNIQ